MNQLRTVVDYVLARKNDMKDEKVIPWGGKSLATQAGCDGY